MALACLIFFANNPRCSLRKAAQLSAAVASQPSKRVYPSSLYSFNFRYGFLSLIPSARAALPPLAHHHRGFHRVQQFARVARPGVSAERLQGAFAQRCSSLTAHSACPRIGAPIARRPPRAYRVRYRSLGARSSGHQAVGASGPRLPLVFGSLLHDLRIRSHNCDSEGARLVGGRSVRLSANSIFIAGLFQIAI